MSYKIGFIGCGNMGSALVKAATLSLSGEKIAVCDHNKEKTDILRDTYGVIPTTAEEIARTCDFVILGVKPQSMQTALSAIAGILQGRASVILVTMAAGLSIASLRTFAGKDFPVIRIMPNTPVTLGEGMILYSADGVCQESLSAFLSFFKGAGIFDCVTEEELDVGGAISGCGPAFTYLFTEALIEGGKELGLSEKQAELYALQMVKGAAEMMLTYKNPAALRRAVCSPNGTTLAGIAAMEEAGFTPSVKAAIKGAYKRTLELKR